MIKVTELQTVPTINARAFTMFLKSTFSLQYYHEDMRWGLDNKLDKI